MKSLFVLLIEAGLLAAAIFVAIFGTDVLDVHKIGWMIRGDSAQHYLGWAFFREAPWQWPLGAMANYGYPFTTTVAFTDSIPLIALPMKVLSPWLPSAFNYFGWWMAACLVGNAVAAAWALHRVGLSHISVLAGACIFAVTPCMMLRAYGHESLMAQGLLVVALGLALLPQKPSVFNGSPWLILLVTCVMVHPYFWVMIFALFVATLVQAWLKNQSLSAKGALAWLSAGMALTAVTLYCLGYFDLGSKTLSAIGYPNYSSNMLTWLDPTDWHWFLQQYQRETAGTSQWSLWMPSLGQTDRDQYEGFAYLGGGMLLLFGCAAGSALVACQGKTAKISVNNANAKLQLWGWPIWCALGLMAVYALSTKVTLGSWVVFDLNRSDTVHRLLSIFRACGRFVWPMTYALMLWSIGQMMRYSPKTQSVMVVLALGLQVTDLSGKLGEFHRMYSPAHAYSTPLSDPRWNELMQFSTHLVVLDDVSQTDDGAAFSFLAAQHQAINTMGVISRINEQQQQDWRQSQRLRLSAGQHEKGRLYVARDDLPVTHGWVRQHLNGWCVLHHE